MDNLGCYIKINFYTTKGHYNKGKTNHSLGEDIHSDYNM